VFSWSNRAEYVRLVLDFRLSEFAAPVRALRAGITSVIPARFLSLLTWKELETEACGQAEIDIEVLKANTVYSGCSPHDVHIKLFWTVLTSFSQLERAQFLRFAGGRSRLPAGSKFSDNRRCASTCAQEGEAKGAARSEGDTQRSRHSCTLHTRKLFLNTVVLLPCQWQFVWTNLGHERMLQSASICRVDSVPGAGWAADEVEVRNASDTL